MNITINNNSSTILRNQSSLNSNLYNNKYNYHNKAKAPTLAPKKVAFAKAQITPRKTHLRSYYGSSLFLGKKLTELKSVHIVFSVLPTDLLERFVCVVLLLTSST